MSYTVANTKGRGSSQNEAGKDYLYTKMFEQFTKRYQQAKLYEDIMLHGNNKFIRVAQYETPKQIFKKHITQYNPEKDTFIDPNTKTVVYSGSGEPVIKALKHLTPEEIALMKRSSSADVGHALDKTLKATLTDEEDRLEQIRIDTVNQQLLHNVLHEENLSGADEAEGLNDAESMGPQQNLDNIELNTALGAVLSAQHKQNERLQRRTENRTERDDTGDQNKLLEQLTRSLKRNKLSSLQPQTSNYKLPPTSQSTNFVDLIRQSNANMAYQDNLFGTNNF